MSPLPVRSFHLSTVLALTLMVITPISAVLPAHAETAPASGASSVAGGEPNRAGAAKEEEMRKYAGDAENGVQGQFSDADRRLMRELAQAHLGEIKMAALATAISGNQAIRAYAEKMLEQHMIAMDVLRKMASAHGVILPGGVDKAHASLLHKLALLTDGEFDQLYLSEAGIADHHQSQRLFEEAARRAQAPQLKTYIAQLVPVIDEHLQLAEKMKDNPDKALALVQATVRAGQSVSLSTLLAARQ